MAFKNNAQPSVVSQQGLLRAPGWAWLCAGGIFCLFLCLVIGYTLARSPWWDEGVFADVAMNFRNHGHLGSSVLAPYSYNNMQGVHHYTYWQFPLYLISVGIWFRILPPTFEVMRLFSLFWACVYLGAWFFFVRALSRNEKLALLITGIIAMDRFVVLDASQGRMETMCVGLGQAALASYVCLRDRNRTLALAIAACLGAASLFCHPMGAVTNALLLVLLLLDCRHLRWRHLFVLSAPYLLGGGLCLWYIAQAPAIFFAQYHTASDYRVSGFAALLKRAWSDLALRYLQIHQAGGRHLKYAVLFGLAGVAAVALSRKLRSIPLARFFLLYAFVSYLGVALVDAEEFPFYLIYSVPMFEACAGMWLYECWRKRTASRFLASTLLAVSIGYTLLSSYVYWQRDTYKTSYEPAIAAIKSYLPPGGVVMAPSEFGFSLGWGPPLIDDWYLGHSSGIRPDVYVMDDICGPGHSPQTHQAWKWSRTMLAEHYELVQVEHTTSPYWIYVRKDLLKSAPSEAPGDL